MYAIKRTNQGGGYVAKPGLPTSYTHNIRKVQIFTTREQAEANRCPDNEVVVDLYPLIGR